MKCLDTYALCEISRGNPKFEKYLSQDFIISELTLVEFYGVILRDFNKLTAIYWLKKLLPYGKPANLALLIKAIEFKVENKLKNLSFFDVVGYVFSKENGCPFVTGDKDFQDMSNVEFVKR